MGIAQSAISRSVFPERAAPFPASVESQADARALAVYPDVRTSEQRKASQAIASEMWSRHVKLDEAKGRRVGPGNLKTAIKRTASKHINQCHSSRGFSGSLRGAAAVCRSLLKPVALFMRACGA